MAWGTVFANLTAGNQPLSIIDAMFNQVAQLVATPCTASGTNAITLSPQSNAPTITGYTNLQMFRFVAANTSTGAITAQFASLASLNVYIKDGVSPAGANNIIAGREYMLIYASALNGGAGGFYLEDPGAIASGTFNVSQGGTGLASLAAYAVLCGGTSALTAMQQVSGLGSAGQVLTSNGAAHLPTWQAGGGGGGGAITPAAQLITTTQTITIPVNATKLLILLAGGGGGGGGAAAVLCGACTIAGTGGPGGPAGVLAKYLAGLTAGNTLALTIGAAGAAGTNAPGNGGAGGNSTLASGTQIITPLTAAGGGGGVAGNGSTGAAGAAGGGTNGDLNWTGSVGVTGLGIGLPGPAVTATSGVGNPGQGYGGSGSGARSVSIPPGSAGGAGTAGAAILIWFV